MSRIQPSIGDYALVGDTRAAALVSLAGSVDWLCVPRFDADPVFGTLIDFDHGGRFEVSVLGKAESRRYRESSTVLETSWRGPHGRAIATDAMPVEVRGFRPQLTLIRRVECQAGEVDVRILFDPRLGLPGRRPKVGRRGDAAICEWGALAVTLQCFPGPAPEPGAWITIRLRQGESVTLAVSLADRTPAVLLTLGDTAAMVEETDRHWRRWCSAIVYDGPFREAVVRSLITLRQLIYSPSGAPLAAPTMALPERIGGDLNWDYRYAWPRDAGVGSGAFMAAGLTAEAEAFLRWLEIASRLTLPRMRVLYTLDGTAGHRERQIKQVTGYRKSRPVRAANEAVEQHQLDVYGWVVDAGWHLESLGRKLDRPTWQMTRLLADFVAEHWREPDAGIWEERGRLRQHVSSKLLAFVALDRAARIARARGRQLDEAARWERERDALVAEVRARGWNTELGSYVATYDGDAVDAALLLVAMSELEDGHPERILGTVDAVRSRLGAGGVLLYRNLPPHGKPVEGAFLPCTFWLADALARAGRVDEAESVLADAIRFGGDLGLFSEEVDPSSGEMLGNYPQALSHSTFVAAALSLEVARESGRPPGSRRTPRARSG